MANRLVRFIIVLMLSLSIVFLISTAAQCTQVLSNGNSQIAHDNVKTITIKWQRLLSDKQTCPRCGSTETEVEKAVSSLKQSLEPAGIRVVLEKRELTDAEFQKDPLQSNKIWINNRPLEDWVGGKIGQSKCCGVCGPADCRTIGVGGEVYEVIPADLIIKAGLLAASQ